jgi:Na+/H+ antiporter NhaD/arsenite permease-like protein
LVNTCILALGTLMASVVGTTGAAMILIRPLLKANEHRAHNVHVVIFFIFLVANIGGALSPLGDPPLFVGFLRGVDFFWTTRTLWGTTALVAGLVLAVFALIDVHQLRKEPHLSDHPYRLTIRIHGWINFALLALVIAMILVSAVWRPNVAIDVFGTPLELQNLVRDSVLVVIALVSLWLTPDEHREANGFSFEPIREVALIFAGIFTTLIPVLAMLQAGKGGAFAWLIAAVTRADGPNAMAYFWLTGVLSALLDNAPTYLVFFELAGGDPTVLMGRLAPILQAISMGAVYMGALTYIGNAPNFMIYAIASERGIKMPSFFGYLVWSVVVLTPVFVILCLVTLAR